MAGAGWKGALVVADLDEVPEGVVGLVRVGFPPVVAGVGGDGFERDGVLQATGQGDSPGPAPERVARRVLLAEGGGRGEGPAGPWCGAGRAWMPGRVQ